MRGEEALVRRFGSEFAKLNADGSVPDIYDIVVVPNNIGIHNNSLNKVLHIGGLCNFIATETKKFDRENVDEVVKALRAAALPPLKFEHTDYKEWEKNKGI